MPKFYVTMTDPFMSGWGKAEAKTNKLVFICDSYAEAGVVAKNALDRGDMERVNIRNSKPYYPKNTHFTQFKTKADYPKWYDPTATW